jgi:Asp/Glu/hydantoin racemase
VITGALDPGFTGSRTVSKIPVTSAIHASVHVASFTGERCSILMASAPGALMVRHVVDRYGLSHKVAGVRYLGHSTTYQCGLLSKYRKNKEERYKVPEIDKVVGDVTAQVIAAAEKENADTFILGCEPMLTYEDEVRRRLNEKGYEEIQLIGSLSAGIAMAKAMVEMKLVKSRLAYPDRSLKLKQEYY